MAVLMTITVPWMGSDDYDAVMQTLDWDSGPTPDGLISHYAWQGDGGWNVIDVWETPEHFGRYAQSHLGPALAEVTGGSPPDLQPTFVQLHRYEHA